MIFPAFSMKKGKGKNYGKSKSNYYYGIIRIDELAGNIGNTGVPSGWM